MPDETLEEMKLRHALENRQEVALLTFLVVGAGIGLLIIGVSAIVGINAEYFATVL